MIAERKQMQNIDNYIRLQEQQKVYLQLRVSRCAVTLHDANAPEQYIAEIVSTPDLLDDDDCDDDSVVYATGSTIGDAIAKLDATLQSML
jgi:hypothetical protein